MNRGFCREQRLLTSQHFKTVFDSPDGKAPSQYLLLLARRNGLDHARLGLVIGKKNVKLSVQRNRVKRLIRESFRHHQVLLAGWDLVIVARRGVAEQDNPELSRQIDKLWKRLVRKTATSEASRPNQADVVHA